MANKSYIGVFLDAASKAALLSCFPAKHPEVFGGHVTLAFGKAMLPESMYPMGEVVTFVVAGVSDANGAQCVAVDLGKRAPLCASGFPHVTISCATGVKPVQSKLNLTAGGTLMPCPALTLTGVVGYPQD